MKIRNTIQTLKKSTIIPFLRNTTRGSLLFLLLLFNLNLFSQISIKASLDSTAILIGDQVHLSLEITQPKGINVQFPMYSDTIIDKVEVLKSGKIDTVSISPSGINLKQDYLITCFDSGLYVMDNIKFIVSNKDYADTVTANPVYMKVFTMQIDTTKNAIFDIKANYNTPFTFDEFLDKATPYAISLLVLILLIFGILYLRKQLKNKEPILNIIKKPKEPAHFLAYKELDKIKEEKLWQKNKVKAYHSELSFVVRKYIEDRFEVMAMEQTTDEIIQAFKYNKLIDTLTLEKLQKILTLSDFVKFAKVQPLPDENDMSIKEAYAFVDATKVRLVEREENTENK